MTDNLTVPEVAALLRCKDWTVRNLAKSKALRGAVVGGRWLFKPEDVEAFIDEQANKPRRRRRRAA
jgi:excisionase family DNA binding protein